ncbi:MAG: ADP-ribosylglycohydrolase family protein [Oscillospiraceae bacterium]|nr:ADP-ribosylglycohydrolase family protein [Oscillospiraceae bacterium]
MALRSAYLGCLLGLAAGDAMGAPVDKLTWREIRADYGPGGIQGYDLTDGSPAITSHTQLCAYTCNGLLLGQTRQRLNGRTAPYARYIALSQKEWANAQRRWSSLQRTYCWVYWAEEFRSRRCADARMMDTLALERIGSPEEPINRLDGPGSLTSAVAAGLFMPGDAQRLGAETVALTYGKPSAFITGAITANLIGRLLRNNELPLMRQLELVLKEADAMFTKDYPQTIDVIRTVIRAVELARAGGSRQIAMEELICGSAAQVLAGAVYTLLTCGDDFDAAMITAVNHSGRSSAVAALTGGFLGAKLGMEGIPAFYLEGLEVSGVLEELADDLFTGCPVHIDLEWDRKYLQGER